MFHPLTGSLSELTLDELITKIGELHTKLSQSYQLGNIQLSNQVRMILSGYQDEYQKRMALAAEKARNDKLLKDKVKVKK